MIQQAPRVPCCIVLLAASCPLLHRVPVGPGAAQAKLAEGLITEEARRATELAVVIDFAGETGRAQALVDRRAAP